MIIVALFFGFMLSGYSFYVEKKLEKDKGYKAVCDITDNASCTIAVKSRYGKIAGFSNAIKGIVFYPLVAFLFWLGYSRIVFALAVAAMIMTLYLAFISYVRMKNYCIVCTGIYIVNLLLLYFSFHNL